MTAISGDELVAAILERQSREGTGPGAKVPTVAPGKGRELALWAEYLASGFASAWRAIGWLVYVAWRVSDSIARLVLRAVAALLRPIFGRPKAPKATRPRRRFRF